MSGSREMRLFDQDFDGDFDEDFEGDTALENPARRTSARTGPAGDYFAAVPVAAGLGWVGADRTGTLTGVELEGTAMTRMRPDRVADLLVAAINQVERTARHQPR